MPSTCAALAILLSSAVAAADPAAAVTVGGYLEAYYQLHLQHPSNHLTALRGFDARDRTITISNVAVDINAARGPVATRLVLQVGATPASYYASEPSLPGASGVSSTSSGLWRSLQQATVAYRTAGAVVIDAGLLPSPIGPEVLAIKDNWNWSRSDLFFGLPFYHTGARLAAPLGGGLVGQLHVYNGWNSVIDNNATPSVGASLGYARHGLLAQLLYLGGSERTTGAPEGQPWRHLLDAYAMRALTREVAVLVHADGGIERTELGTSGWVAGAVSTKVDVTPALYLAARGDAFREWVGARGARRAASIFWPTPWIASGTLTAAWQPAAGLSIRLEVRHDRAGTPAFFGGQVAGNGVTDPFTPDRRVQDTATVGVIAWF